MLEGDALRALEERNVREVEAGCRELRATTPQGIEAGRRAFKWAEDAGLQGRQLPEQLATHFEAAAVFAEESLVDLLADMGPGSR